MYICASINLNHCLCYNPFTNIIPKSFISVSAPAAVKLYPKSRDSRGCLSDVKYKKHQR